MNTKHILYMMLCAATALSSCVRDDIQPCPPLQVNLTVKDKNYFNVDKVELEERLADDLAFREYVPTLHYMLRDAVTGEMVEEQGVFPVEGDGKTFPITFCDCISHGKYILTVWGGLEDLSLLTADHTAINFHPAGIEGRDVYFTNDTLVYDAWNYDYTVDLERTKGKLIIQTTKLTDDIRFTDKSVSGLFASMDSNAKYAGETTVGITNAWDTPVEIVSKTVLTPSVKKDGSVLKVNFYDTPQPGTPLLTPKDVKITMKRNELTVLRYVYDEVLKDFSIFILVNDNWEVVHGMEID